MAGHPSGDKNINREHIDKQRKGDQELAEGASTANKGRQKPGTGRPDPDEGVRTNQNQRK